jgi:hypothetical protein
VHVIAPDGRLAAGYDRFDADAFSLRPGDRVLQRYLPQLPADLAPGEYRLFAGMYDPVSGARFPTGAGLDHYQLGSITVTP